MWLLVVDLCELGLARDAVFVGVVLVRNRVSGE